jgi:hypothetical protein
MSIDKKSSAIDENSQRPANNTAKDASEITDIHAYRVLNSFKEAGAVDGKKLTREHGGSPQFWGSKKSVMVRSPVPYTMLKEVGFAEGEIADWVKRPKGVAKTVQAPAKKAEAPAKTAHTEVKEDEITTKELPMETPSHHAINQQPLQSSTIFNQLEQSRSYSRSYAGYSEAQLKQMDAQQLKELGIAKAQDSFYTVSQGENGRIVLDPVPWEVREDPGRTGDPAVGIAIESFSAEIASRAHEPEP